MSQSQTRGPEPLIRVGDDFEDEYPGASALATECFANLWRTADVFPGAVQLVRQAIGDEFTELARRIPDLAA